jgi:hypothetical protein
MPGELATLRHPHIPAVPGCLDAFNGVLLVLLATLGPPKLLVTVRRLESRRAVD